MKAIVLVIFFAYLLSMIKNIIVYKHKEDMFRAIKYRKKLKLSNKKYLDLNNDYDFIKLLLLSEHLAYGEAIYTNPSERLIKCANIISSNEAEKYQDFLNKEKQKILSKIKQNKRILFIKILIAIIIIIFSLVIFLY